jgi:hypothetical protein
MVRAHVEQGDQQVAREFLGNMVELGEGPMRIKLRAVR